MRAYIYLKIYTPIGILFLNYGLPFFCCYLYFRLQQRNLCYAVAISIINEKYQKSTTRQQLELVALLEHNRLFSC